MTRKLTARKGVDVVFEHVGADTWQGSLLVLKRGGRLVTCGATSGPAATLNLMQLVSATVSDYEARSARRFQRSPARSIASRAV